MEIVELVRIARLLVWISGKWVGIGRNPSVVLNLATMMWVRCEYGYFHAFTEAVEISTDAHWFVIESLRYSEYQPKVKTFFDL